MEQFRAVALIPAYNNGRTVGRVVDAVRPLLPDIIVVDDGSTDQTADELRNLEVETVHIAKNRGKGHALRLGFARAAERGFTHVVTVDADGQHGAADVATVLDAAREEPGTLWIGNRVLDPSGVAQPARSRFGARFGSFWYRFHTGLHIDDTQCGLRAYPLRRVAGLHCSGSRYEYEIDILIKAAWARVPVKQVPIRLLYQPAPERVSHFRPVRDFARISVVNSRAALTRIFMPWRFIDAPGATVWDKVRFLVIRELTSHHSPRRAAAALALGAFLGVTPFHGFQVVSAMGLSLLLRLNRALTFLGVAISSPPFLPFWIAAGYGVGTVVTPTALLATVGRQASRAGFQTIGALLNPAPEATRAAVIAVQWAVGSMALAVVVGLLVFAIAYPVLRAMDKRTRRRSGTALTSPRRPTAATPLRCAEGESPASLDEPSRGTQAGR